MKSIKLKCAECGGGCENGVCLFCGNKKPGKTIEELTNLIKPYSDIEEYYENLRRKIFYGVKLELKEDEIFYILLENEWITDDGLDDFFVLSHILHDNKIISYKTFEALMLRSAEKTMRMINNNIIENYYPKALILNLKGAKGGALGNNTIIFNKLIIEQLYEGYFYPLCTYFHEIQHISQSLVIEFGYVSKDIMNIIKDTVIQDYEDKRYHTDKYYKDNYYNITFEIEAHDIGINNARNLMIQMGFNNLDDYFKKYRTLWPGASDFNRVIRSGKEKIVMTLDDIFEQIINLEPKYLDVYPQLKLEYINEDGIVRKRTKSELVDLYLSKDKGGKKDYLIELITNLSQEEHKKK